MDDILRLQQDIVDKLNAHSWFTDVPVVAHRPLSTTDAIGSASTANTAEVQQEEFWRVKKDGTKSGLGVLVAVPELRVPYPNLPGPQYEARIRVRVAEQPLVSEAADGLNPAGAGKSAGLAASKVAAALHQWAPNGWMQTHLREQAIVPVAENKVVRIYDVWLWTTLPQAQESRTVRPTITVAGGNASIACAEAADIYYTVDGGFPSQQAGATLYAAPFAVAAGTTIRAAAYASGKEGSDVHQGTA